MRTGAAMPNAIGSATGLILVTEADATALVKLFRGAEDPSGWFGATTEAERDEVNAQVMSLMQRISAALPAPGVVCDGVTHSVEDHAHG